MTWQPRQSIGVVLAVALVAAAMTGGWRLNRAFPNQSDWFTGQVAPSAMVLDTRGSLSYSKGHIPGAPRLWSRDLLSYSAARPGVLKDPAEIAKRVTALGLAPGSEVVVYDQGTGADAPLVALVLTALGMNVRVLVGGYDRWVASGGAVSQDPVPVISEAANPDWKLDPALLVPMDVVLQAQSTDDVTLVDARDAIDFGAQHLQMAVNVPAGNLAPDGALPRWSEAAWLMAPTGIEADTPVVIYGAELGQAARTWLSLRAYGVGPVQVFAGPFAVLAAAGLAMEASAGGAAARTSSVCFGAVPAAGP